MSAQSVESVLNRAMSDTAFADQLFRDAEKALTGVDLTAEELTALKSMSRAEFDKVAQASPEERKSFIGLGGHNHNETALTLQPKEKTMNTETILSRMMNEPDFAESVFIDAAKALMEYNLSAEELAKFKELFHADFEAFAAAPPEERKSFGWGNHNETALNL